MIGAGTRSPEMVWLTLVRRLLLLSHPLLPLPSDRDNKRRDYDREGKESSRLLLFSSSSHLTAGVFSPEPRRENDAERSERRD